MSTPTIKAVRSAFPSARLDFFVGTWSRQAIDGNPHIDNIFDCGRVGAGSYTVNEYLRLVKRLRQGRYDVCFVLERSVFITILPFLAGIPNRIGLDSDGRGFSLTVKIPCDEVKHEVERYLDTARAVGINVQDCRLEFYPNKKDLDRARELLTNAGALRFDPTSERNGSPFSTTPLVVIHPAGGANPGMQLLAKRWPAERFAAVADRLVERYNATVVIVGAEADIPVVAEMDRAMTRRSINLAGRMTIRELGAVLAFSDLFLGNDTGPLHLAVAVGVPVVAIFGPTDEKVYGPYSDEATIVSGAAVCRPCFVKGAARSCSTNDCIASISIEQVWQAVEKRLLAKGFSQINSAVERRV